MGFGACEFVPAALSRRRLMRRREYEAFAEGIRLRRGRLNASERALVELVLERSLTFAEIARAAGVNASTVCRRYHRCLRKLAPDETGRVGALDRRVCRDSRAGLTQAQIAAKLNITRYRVRKALAHEA